VGGKDDFGDFWEESFLAKWGLKGSFWGVFWHFLARMRAVLNGLPLASRTNGRLTAERIVTGGRQRQRACEMGWSFPGRGFGSGHFAAAPIIFVQASISLSDLWYAGELASIFWIASGSYTFSPQLGQS
jgi:hypothetical protein